MTSSLSASKGSALLLDHQHDDSPCLKETPGPSADSVSNPRFLKPSVEVDFLLELSPKDALDVNGMPGHVEATALPAYGGSRPASLTVEVPRKTLSTWSAIVYNRCKTMTEFRPTGKKLENPHSRLVPPSSNRNKPKGFQQSSHRAASTVCSSYLFAILQSDEALSTVAPGVTDSIKQ
ncbi:hypothetical protein Nepgr_010469 [Nepenthes gracilis]|uniref:Uncharacterized protein n=1 Tax=Nepenthes gracilis TaxID=150966 RepID=A0AAD3SDF2_NEPGR|nr:hypothetical protein Nepgr_010469 [Nepenthes gracilis]